MVVARTVFLDELVIAACADGARQVVLLGAGFDTRAFRLPWPPGVRCFELDTQDVLDSKQQVLTAQHAVPGCERITISGDLRDDWPAALRAAGLRPDEPTAWVAEGLLVYLSPDDVDQLLDRVTDLSAPGSRLGLTFRNRAPADQASPLVVRQTLTSKEIAESYVPNGLFPPAHGAGAQQWISGCVAGYEAPPGASLPAGAP